MAIVFEALRQLCRAGIADAGEIEAQVHQASAILSEGVCECSRPVRANAVAVQVKTGQRIAREERGKLLHAVGANLVLGQVQMLEMPIPQKRGRQARGTRVVYAQARQARSSERSVVAVQPLQDVVPAGDEGRDVCLQVSLQKQAGSIPLQRSSRLRHKGQGGGHIHSSSGCRLWSKAFFGTLRARQTLYSHALIGRANKRAIYMRSPVRPPIYAPAKVRT